MPKLVKLEDTAELQRLLTCCAREELLRRLPSCHDSRVGGSGGDGGDSGSGDGGGAGDGGDSGSLRTEEEAMTAETEQEAVATETEEEAVATEERKRR